MENLDDTSYLLYLAIIKASVCFFQTRQLFQPLCPTQFYFIRAYERSHACGLGSRHEKNVIMGVGLHPVLLP